MGKQSARLYFEGQDHKDIYFQGNYHNKMYIGNQLVWEKLPIERNLYFVEGRGGVVDYKNKTKVSGHRLFLLENGFVTYFDGYIQYSKDLTTWIRLHEIDETFYAIRCINGDELYGLKSIQITGASYETTVFRYSIKEKSYAEIQIDSEEKLDIVGNGFCCYLGYFYIQNNQQKSTGITLYKIGKEGYTKIDVPADSKSGDTRIYRSGIFYAVNEQAYFIKKVGTRSGSNVLYKDMLSYYGEDGEEHDVCDIYSSTSNGWGENTPNRSYIYVLDAENHKIYHQGYLITISKDGKSASTEKFNLNLGFEINTYENGKKIDDSISFHKASYLSPTTDYQGGNARVENGVARRDCVNYEMARYNAETKTYDGYLVMIRDFFYSPAV